MPRKCKPPQVEWQRIFAEQQASYAGYEQAQASLAGCWAHARRKFIEAKTRKAKRVAAKPIRHLITSKYSTALRRS